jgi:hypothetical protein
LSEATYILDRLLHHDLRNRQNRIPNKDGQLERFLAKAIRNLCKIMERRIML